jgi:hypothetical protein
MNSIPPHRRGTRKGCELALEYGGPRYAQNKKARAFLRIRKYCSNDLILERLPRAFEEKFAYYKLDDV